MPHRQGWSGEPRELARRGWVNSQLPISDLEKVTELRRRGCWACEEQRGASLAVPRCSSPKNLREGALGHVGCETSWRPACAAAGGEQESSPLALGGVLGSCVPAQLAAGRTDCIPVPSGT